MTAIGEFSYLCGQWWERDYYYSHNGVMNRWVYVSGEFYPEGDRRWCGC